MNKVNKVILLTDEEIADLLAFLNRTGLGNNNAIGEAKTLINVVDKIENNIELSQLKENLKKEFSQACKEEGEKKHGNKVNN